MAFRCSFGDRVQVLAQADLEDPKTLDLYRRLLPDKVRVVYSDPPWNPGNATYWRTHAGQAACESYDAFLDCWCAVVRLCVERGALDLLCEQSSNEKHSDMARRALHRSGVTWPLSESWTVYYGSPGSAGCRRPNQLLHFGSTPLKTNPEGMRAESMTIRACAGLGLISGDVIVDPCMGKGMTSRMGHYFDCDVVGTELNPKRLDKTLQWLKGHGYEVEEFGS